MKEFVSIERERLEFEKQQSDRSLFTGSDSEEAREYIRLQQKLALARLRTQTENFLSKQHTASKTADAIDKEIPSNNKASTEAVVITDAEKETKDD